MDKNQKIALWVLGFFSVTIIVIFFINFDRTLKDPFSYRGSKTVFLETGNNNQSNCSDGSCVNKEPDVNNLELKNVDTDGDGISDWDEIFIYGTSPYLEDTDGDNLSDYEEIFLYKTDPNCPEGQVCSKTLEEVNKDVDSNFSQFMGLLDGLDSGDKDISDSEKVFKPSSEADMLRQILIQSGVDSKDLDMISDEDLMKMFEDIASGKTQSQ
ncbi:MAG: hypothetical protein ACOXZ1_03370 [Patescibacteria group bacterium]|jgi:hypothetical protein|nr:hypothetical protein [Patescibacteria group bacterium]